MFSLDCDLVKKLDKSMFLILTKDDTSGRDITGLELENIRK